MTLQSMAASGYSTTDNFLSHIVNCFRWPLPALEYECKVSMVQGLFTDQQSAALADAVRTSVDLNHPITSSAQKLVPAAFDEALKYSTVPLHSVK